MKRLLLLLFIPLLAFADSGRYKQLTLNGPDNRVISPFDVDMTMTSNDVTFLWCNLYLDSVLKAEASGASVSASLSASVGRHNVTVQCYDSSNYWTKQTIFVQVIGGHVLLNWLASPDSGVEYRVYRSSDNVNFQALDDTSDLTFEDLNAIPGTTYYYRVTSVLNGQQSTPSNTVTVNIPS